MEGTRGKVSNYFKGNTEFFWKPEPQHPPPAGYTRDTRSGSIKQQLLK